MLLRAHAWADVDLLAKLSPGGGGLDFAGCNDDLGGGDVFLVGALCLSAGHRGIEQSTIQECRHPTEPRGHLILVVVSLLLLEES